MSTMSTILPICPDSVRRCTAHELTIDAVRGQISYYNDHCTRVVSIPTSPGVPYRALDGHLGGSGEGVIVTVHAFEGSMDRPVIAIEINSDTSGSPDLLWATHRRGSRGGRGVDPGGRPHRPAGGRIMKHRNCTPGIADAVAGCSTPTARAWSPSTSHATEHRTDRSRAHGRRRLRRSRSD